jgi:hypothetical protein
MTVTSKGKESFQLTTLPSITALFRVSMKEMAETAVVSGRFGGREREERPSHGYTRFARMKGKR